MDFTDQPGRIFAVFVASPILFYKGIAYNDVFIIAFAIGLFGWDLYWLLFNAPKHSLLLTLYVNPYKTKSDELN